MSRDRTLQRPRSAARLRRRTPARVGLRAGLLSLVAGPLVGFVWWLSTPGGGRSPGDTYLDLVQSAGATDAAFALACLGAGSLAGIWWVLARDEVHDTRAVGRLVGLLVGGLVAAWLAWGAGAALQVVVPAQVGDLPADVVADLTAPRLSPAVVAGTLLWPLATGVMVLVDTLRELVVQALGRD